MTENIRARLASHLTAGQRAVEVITTTASRVVGDQGYAGTGKSHMLDQAKAVAEEHRYRVVAIAQYSAQVRALRELGVEARTLASFLAAREEPLDSRTVLVIDEAGTVPTRQMEQALKLAEQAEAHVVLLGDTRQPKAIEAGRPFDQLQGWDANRTHEAVQQQKDAALREAVSLAANGESRASLPCIHRRERDQPRRLGRLGSRGRGHEFATLTRRDTQAERTSRATTRQATSSSPSETTTGSASSAAPSTRSSRPDPGTALPFAILSALHSKREALPSNGQALVA